MAEDRQKAVPLRSMSQSSFNPLVLDPWLNMVTSSFDDGLPRAPPKSQMVQPEDIRRMLEQAKTEGIELHSFMLYRRGFVISEGWWWPYRPGLQHTMHSATKSFLSTAVGFAIHERYFSLDDKVISFFPDKIPADAGPNLLQMTVEDLLTQTSGHAYGVSSGTWRSITTSWVDEFFKIPVPHKPGTMFQYSSATSFMLSAIISRTTGQNARDFLQSRLFDPLQIQGLLWDTTPDGISSGGNGIRCTTSDLLKLAKLHLDKGWWNGRRILPEVWVNAATSKQRSDRYGYHWWMGDDISFHAYGVFGQFAFVFPGHQGILAVTAAAPGGEHQLRSLISRHLPAMFRSEMRTTIPQEPSLDQLLRNLRLLPALVGKSSAPFATPFSSFFSARPNADEILAFSIEIQRDTCTLCIQDTRGMHQIDAGMTYWRESETSMSGARLHHGYEWSQMRIVAGARWKDLDVLEVTCQFIETPFRDTWVIRFANGTAMIDRSVNVNTFGTKRPTVLGDQSDVGDLAGSTADKLADIAIRSTDQASSPFLLMANAPLSSTTSTIGELLDNSAARTTLVRYIPKIVDSGSMEPFRLYTLDSIAGHVPELTPETLNRIDEDLGYVSQA